MNWFKKSQIDFHPAGGEVSGLTVRNDVPNSNSISATFDNYQIQPGVREVPMSAFESPGFGYFYNVRDKNNAMSLAEQIRESQEISPLIVAIDHEGPYILEGQHRFFALAQLGIQSFPALIVIDLDDQEDPIIGK